MLASPTIATRVAVRLVARVDDRTLERRLEPDHLLDELRAL
jgi:hypothetical protein